MKRSFFLFLFVLLSSSQLQGYYKKAPTTRYYLSVLAIFRDEALWLKEWLEYHLLVGVEHFYLINHLSEDNYLEVLQPYIDKGLVTLMDHWDPPTRSGMPPSFYFLQQRNYDRAIWKHKRESYWMAIIDLDEFLVPIQGDSLPPILKPFEREVGIRVNWMTFGTGEVEEVTPDELLIEKLLWRAEDKHWTHYIVKSIVQPTQVQRCRSAHFFSFLNGRLAVDTNFTPQILRQPHSMALRNLSVLRDKLVVHHYRFRDKKYLKEKKGIRGKQYQDMRFHTQDVMEEMNKEASSLYDPTMLRFIPELRRRLGLDEQGEE